MVGWRRQFLPEILGGTPLERSRRYQPIFARSFSAVTPSEKSSINTNTKSTTRFPMSLRLSSYVVPKFPKECLKTQNGRFSSKIDFAWRKSATKFLSVKLSAQSYKAFISLTIPAKMIRGGATSST